MERLFDTYVISPLWAVATLVLCGTVFGSCAVALVYEIYHGLKEKRDSKYEELEENHDNSTKKELPKQDKRV